MTKARLAVGGLALAITIGACGAGPVSGQASPAGSDTLFGNAKELVRVASAKTDQAKTAKFTITETIGGTPITTHGEGRYDGPNTAIKTTMSVVGMEMETRIVDQAVYVKFPAEMGRAMTAGKPWGRFSAGNPIAKVMGATAGTAEQNDPTRILDQVQQAGTITKSEKTTLDGQPVTHYWVDIDFAKALETFATGFGLPADGMQGLADAQVVIPMELWLNQDSLPVQITEDLTAITNESGLAEAGMPVNIMVKYSDWGTPVDVQAPPADQVGELTLDLDHN
ncbi:hypothetical protein [Amycolatopsis taiwanensis]|uniref:hypothetical protein n=1 Tax=Amycolatopsis taiwanensis TaxID=342230 RepID=UPI000488BE03|nr:hypothetical protein [Amycolatopsis taiwanensis]